MRARAQGQLTACKSSLKNIGTAMEMYSEEHDGKYPEEAGLAALVPKYLKTLPECPAAQQMSYTSVFGPKAEGNQEHFENFYQVQCSGHHHKAVSVDENYPKYNGVVGLIERAPRT